MFSQFFSALNYNKKNGKIINNSFPLLFDYETYNQHSSYIPHGKDWTYQNAFETNTEFNIATCNSKLQNMFIFSVSKLSKI